METIAELLRDKGHEVVTVTIGTTVFDALKVMDERNIGAVMIVDSAGKPIGILTERDYARKIVLAGRNSKETPVTQIMTREVVYVRPNQSVEEAMAIMIGKRCRHLPVIDNGSLVGLISIGDVVKATIKEKEYMIDQLEHYIAGSL